MGLHEVDPGHLLRHGVFHLEARVGFDEHEWLSAVPARNVNQELEGPEVGVAHMLREPDGGADYPRAEVAIEIGRGRHFHHLLKAPLDAAFSLSEVCDRTILVAEDLHFDVSGSGDELLDVDILQSKRRFGLGLAAAVGGIEVFCLKHRASAAAASARDRLDHHGADRAARFEKGARLFQRDCVIETAENGDPGRHSRFAGAGFVTEQLQVLNIGPDEGDVGRCAHSGKVRSFREKAVSRMDRVATARRRGGNDRRTVEVGLRAGAGKGVRIVRDADVQAAGVIFRIDGHGAQSKVRGSAGDADCDFSAIGDQEGCKRQSASLIERVLRANS